MERHPRKNEITNALGLPNMQPPTLCNAPIEADAGNCFLLCSDGLTGMVADEQIQRVISKHEIPIQQRADILVKMANDNGGVDNITVELVEFTVGTQQIGSGGKKPANWKKLLLYLSLVLVVLGGLAWFLLTKDKPVPDLANNETPQETKDTVTQQEQGKVGSFIIPETFVAKPVVFTKKGKTLETEIMLFNDSIIDKNVKYRVEKNTVNDIRIEGNRLRAKWQEKRNTVIILCKTRDGNDCTIKIPVENGKEQAGNTPQPIKITLDAITYKYKKLIIVKTDGSIKLFGNVKEIHQYPAVRCSVNADNNLVLFFNTQDFESPVIVTVTTVANATYEFSIPVKIPETPKNKQKEDSLTINTSDSNVDKQGTEYSQSDIE
jgi:hypothetical protein